jgi:acyl carrier protein
MSNDAIEAMDIATIKATTAQIWNEVLDVQEGQESATFFELKGQSITAVQIATRIEDELGIWVDVGDLFEDPDLETFVSDVVAKHDGAAG